MYALKTVRKLRIIQEMVYAKHFDTLKRNEQIHPLLYLYFVEKIQLVDSPLMKTFLLPWKVTEDAHCCPQVVSSFNSLLKINKSFLNYNLV